MNTKDAPATELADTTTEPVREEAVTCRSWGPIRIDAHGGMLGWMQPAA